MVQYTLLTEFNSDINRNKHMIDEKDREILSILISDGGTSKAEIGRRTGLAPSVVADRMKRLEANDVITGYEVRLNPSALGKPLLAFTFVTDAKPSAGFAAR